ncbi:enoyl-CoA hydratase-related protein, partial [Acinetobacter baumannii]|nr:enoyl-CoA hydratase-related protein [Acinetobacter baumannii]MCW1766150.1 enoyl-CoA hydratase-related protein [Acinetobacter baumannii]
MSETTQDILVHTEAGVCTITFNRADKKNSITEAMYASMADALAQAGEDAAVRCVVFQGDMAIFSAGNDIADFLKQSAGGAARPEGEQRPVWRFLHN